MSRSMKMCGLSPANLRPAAKGAALRARGSRKLPPGPGALGEQSPVSYNRLQSVTNDDETENDPIKL